MSAKLKIKRGTTSAWNSTDSSIDTTLEPGQLGVEYLDDGNMRLKVGKQTADGSATAWSDLPYVTPSSSIYKDAGIYFQNTSPEIVSEGSDTGSLLRIANIVSNDSANGTVRGVELVNSYKSSSSVVSSRLRWNTLNGNPILFSTGYARLGSQSYPWGEEYVGSLYASNFYPYTGTKITVNTNLVPSTNSTSDSTGYSLGDSSYKWRYLYSYSGVIQTSDRSAKDSIHYLESSETESDSTSPRPLSLSYRGLMDDTATTFQSSGSSSDLVTVDDVIDFVSKLSPATFCYKNGQGVDTEATEENSDPEEIQLGLIADDIKDHKLFKYIGVETTYEEEVTPAVKDEEGNVVTEAVTETKTTRGLQAIPLATAALTACKYLIQKNEEIESRLAIIEEQLEALLSKDGN